MSVLALPALAHTLKPANSINWKMIREEEGDTRVLYIPVKLKDGLKNADLNLLQKSDAANYKVLGRSGATVGAGVDLGQQDLDKVLARVTDQKIRSSLHQKLKQFAGGKKDAAVKAMRDTESRAIGALQQSQPELMSQLGIGYGDAVVSAGPQPRRVMNEATGKPTAGRVLAPGYFGEAAMTLTDAEANALTRAVSELLAGDLSTAFNARARQHKMQFALYPWQAQTAMMSLRYHTGSKPGSNHAAHKKHAEFWRAMTRGDLKNAVKHYEEDIVKTAPNEFLNRRKKELHLLREAAAQWKSPASPSLTRP